MILQCYYKGFAEDNNLIYDEPWAFNDDEYTFLAENKDMSSITILKKHHCLLMVLYP